MDYFNFKEEFLYQFIDLMEKSKMSGALNLVMEGLPGESITMTFKEYDRYCPVVSIEELFLRSQYEMLPVRILASETLQEFQTAETGGIRLKMDAVKNPLFVEFHAVNANKYQKRLEELELPYTRMGDMCIYYRFRVKEENEKLVYTMPVDEEDLQRWGMHVDQLHACVSDNSFSEYSVKIEPVAAVIREGLEEGFTLGRGKITNERASAWRLTGLGGAAGMLYRNILDEFAEEVNTDLYLLPVTAEETAIYAADQYTPADLQMRLERKKSLKGFVSHPLSESVLYYSLKSKTLTVHQSSLVKKTLV